MPWGPPVTIVASVKVHDGIVLGADSMTQLWGDVQPGVPQFLKAYDHAQKLYQIAGLPVGAMAYGVGNIGPRSIGSLMAEYSRKLGATDVRGITEGLFTFLKGVHEQQFANVAVEQRPALGVYVGGYSPDGQLPEEWEFQIPSPEGLKSVRPADAFGASWRGIHVPFSRLFAGIDPRMLQELVAAGVNQDQLNALSTKYRSAIMFDGMPIQEAIEFVAFILETTINAAKFEVGVASCGGPLWIAVATTKEFKWVRRHEWAFV